MKINTKIRDACRKAGLIGGRVSAMKLSPEQRSARSTITGNITLQRFGLDYYSSLGKLSAQRRKERAEEKARVACEAQS
jgi:hypothetical protein